MKSTAFPAAAAIDPEAFRVAIIGAGMAGAACATGLRHAGAQVTLFDKSRQVGGRMATRRARCTDAAGIEHEVSFDHGAQCFAGVRPRFRAVMTRAVAAGCASSWQPRVHSSRSAESVACFVATPTMPALCRHLMAGASVHLQRTVRRLLRAADGQWHVASDGAALTGPFHHVVLAMPPAQAAILAAGHRDDWADALVARHMEPRWTLMAVTDEVDWPWDAAEPDRGPLAWVSRSDRVPGRAMLPGLAVWTAHATAEWSAAHLEAESQTVRDKLQAALRSQLPSAVGSVKPIGWHHLEVHRWRFAGPAFDCDDSFDSDEAWWDESLGLGVCGDFMGGGVEAAWHSGDELADSMAASFESKTDVSAVAWAMTH